MEDPGEELEADDGVDDDDEDDEEGDVEQRDHRHEDGVQDNLGGKGLKSGNDFLFSIIFWWNKNTMRNAKYLQSCYCWIRIMEIFLEFC